MRVNFILLARFAEYSKTYSMMYSYIMRIGRKQLEYIILLFSRM